MYKNNSNNSIQPLSNSPLWTMAGISTTEKSPKISRQDRRKKKLKTRIWKKRFSNATRDQHSKLDCKTIMTLFLQNSSIYSLNRIGNSPTTMRKLFWLLIFVVGVAGCLSQVGQFLALYYKYPVVINLESLNKDYQVFPGVTVCNMNPVRREYEHCVEKLLNYDECLGINLTDRYQTSNYNGNDTLPECDYDLSYFPTTNQTSTNWFYVLVSQSYNSRVKYGHEAADFIYRCIYNNLRCGPQHFKRSISYIHGNCYTFDGASLNLTSYMSGPASGLLLELDLEADKYATFTRTISARVQVHDPHLEHNVDARGIYITPGYETHVAVTKTVMSRLSAPYKDRCRNYEVGSSQEKCEEDCYFNLTTSLCFCSTAKRLHADVPQCNFTDPLIWCCLRKCDERMQYCDCPLSCEETEYKIQVSHSVWPSRVHYKTYRDYYRKSDEKSNNLSYENFRETRLRLKVYHDSLDYTKYKQRPLYQSSDILSQIGGQMGLWLGLSLVVIFECFESILIYCRRKS